MKTVNRFMMWVLAIIIVLGGGLPLVVSLIQSTINSGIENCVPDNVNQQPQRP